MCSEAGEESIHFHSGRGHWDWNKKKKKWYRATPLLLRSEMKFPICFTVQHSFKSSTFWPLLNHFRGVWNITCVAAEIIHFLHSFPWLAIVFEKSTKSLILQQFDRNEIRLFLKWRCFVFSPRQNQCVILAHLSAKIQILETFRFRFFKPNSNSK